MKKLDEIIFYNNMKYVLIKRTDNTAMYNQFLLVNEDGENKEYWVGIEVFKIIKQSSSTKIIGGKEVPFEAKELFPSNERFGIDAFTLKDIHSANKKFDFLENEFLQSKVA